MGDHFSKIQLKEVRKVFGRQPALKGVSFSLSQGRATLLMGPNGAGKSTLLTILSTLSRPTSGQVLFGSEEQYHDHRYAEQQLRGKIGLMAHAPMLYPELSGRENLVFFARMYRVPLAREVAASWLERVDLQEAADKPVRQLSRGMTQRLALARALLHDPNLLLLDEPFTGLDRQATQILRAEVERALERGKIILMVTHDAEAVSGICEHLVVLKHGRVATDFTPPSTEPARLTTPQILERYHGAI